MLSQSVVGTWKSALQPMLVLICLSAFLAACGVRKDLQSADVATGQFHSQLDSEQYHAIYEITGDEFRKVTNEADLTALLQAVHRKLGNVRQCKRQAYRVNFSTGQGEVISVDYSAEFEGGSGSENFLWQFNGGKILLLGYHINSNALILK